MDATEVISNYTFDDQPRLQALGSAGGFSGAMFWKVVDRERTFMLRRWPQEYPDRDHLDFIHRVLIHAHTNGTDAVARPRKTKSGESIVGLNGYLWELADWKRGTASYHDAPTDEKLRSAMEELARFHMGAAQVHLNFASSQTVDARLAVFRSAKPLLSSIRNSARTSPTPFVHRMRSKIVGDATIAGQSLLEIEAVERTLRPFGGQMFPVQPAIRDVWHDHLLFEGDQLTGLVDFGGMRVDSIAVDLARLLGSLLGDNRPAWEKALGYYSTVRPLSELERQMAIALDRANVWCGLLNWMNWIYVEQRDFSNWNHVDRMLAFLDARLSNART